MNLQELRDYIRMQLDMDEEELPNALLDSYLSEGFLRTISQEVRWPFYEHRWDVAKIDGVRTITIPPDCDPVGIMALIDTTIGRPPDAGRQRASPTTTSWQMNAEGAPYYYSIEADLIYLHPSRAGGHGQLPAAWSPLPRRLGGCGPRCTRPTATCACTSCSPTTPSPCATPSRKTRFSKTCT